MAIIVFMNQIYQRIGDVKEDEMKQMLKRAIAEHLVLMARIVQKERTMTIKSL